jgi:hypothetical protein
LRSVQRDVSAGCERGVNKKPGTAKIVAGH